MARVSPAMETCTLARSIGVIGDWWTLLILRNALLVGHSRFDQFHRHLGIATNILTGRLNDLVEAGILARVASEHPRSRYEYQVTQKGLELWPVLSAMLDWGNRWTADEQAPSRRLLHERCGGVVHTGPHCSACDETLDPAQISLEPPAAPKPPAPPAARKKSPQKAPQKAAKAARKSAPKGQAGRTARARAGSP